MASYVFLAGIAAAIAVKPCHRFERTDFKRLTEYVAGRNRFSSSIAMFVSKHEVSPLKFSIEAASEKSTSAQNPLLALWEVAHRRVAPALPGSKTLAVGPLDHLAFLTVFGSRLSPNSILISDHIWPDRYARLCCGNGCDRSRLPGSSLKHRSCNAELRGKEY